MSVLEQKERARKEGKTYEETGSGVTQWVEKIVNRAVLMTSAMVVGSHQQISNGSFSAVSKPNFVSTYSLEGS